MSAQGIFTPAQASYYSGGNSTENTLPGHLDCYHEVSRSVPAKYVSFQEESLYNSPQPSCMEYHDSLPGSWSSASSSPIARANVSRTASPKRRQPTRRHSYAKTFPQPKTHTQPRNLSLQEYAASELPDLSLISSTFIPLLCNRLRITKKEVFREKSGNRRARAAQCAMSSVTNISSELDESSCSSSLIASCASSPPSSCPPSPPRGLASPGISFELDDEIVEQHPAQRGLSCGENSPSRSLLLEHIGGLCESLSRKLQDAFPQEDARERAQCISQCRDA